MNKQKAQLEAFNNLLKTLNSEQIKLLEKYDNLNDEWLKSLWQQE